MRRPYRVLVEWIVFFGAAFCVGLARHADVVPLFALAWIAGGAFERWEARP
jgi:TRAP-type C4-dicarboxylate transport system permease small subunit